MLGVLTLGDSFTIGYEVHQDQTYSHVLETYLNQHGIAAEVINGGVSGFGNAEQLIFFEQVERMSFTHSLDFMWTKYIE